MSEYAMEKLIDIGADGVYISIDAATKETCEKIRVGWVFNNVKKFIEI